MKTAVCFALFLVAALSAGAAPTTITLTDRVLVPEVERLGVHFSGDTFYDSVILKRRVAENFEGGILREHVIGPSAQPDEIGFYSWNGGLDEDWVGATAHILCGPDIWHTRQVKKIETRPNPAKKNAQSSYLVFDKPVRWNQAGSNAGVMLERTDLTGGQHPWMERKIRKEGGKRTITYEIDEQYCSPENTGIAAGDTPPEVGQYAAFRLDGSKKKAWIRFRVQFNDAAPYGGEWTTKIWLKAVKGKPVVTISPTVPGSEQKLSPTDEWKQYTVPLTLQPAPAGQNPIFMLEVSAAGGAVLIDNVEAWKDGDGTNPTPFRDELVDVFMFMNPGSVRYLRNTKDTYLNSLLPRIENFAKDGRGTRGTDDFGVHEFYDFCKYIDANPWATIPGTVLLEEMDLLMEYHAGPAGTTGGDLRIRLGQEKPWTDVFDKIHLQFGNEAITFFGTGFYGPDYWSALIARCKASPYWQEDKFVFHLNEQGCGTRGMDEHPAFDRFTINGYHIFGLYDDQIEAAGDLEGFYDFVFASAWHMWKEPGNNKWWSALEMAKTKGKEISIYEGLNYHTTFGDKNPPMDRINHMMAGRAGGMSAVHTGLLLLKHWGGRTQQNFNLSQLSFSPGGAFGNLPERIRGWGGVLRIGNAAERRCRPRFLAQHIANQVMGGDLVETVHTGADPKYEITNRFGTGYGPSRNPKQMTISEIPRIHSYGFAEGRRRGLILVSNDPREAQPIILNFDGTVKGGKAKVWWLDSENLEDTNEHDWEPEGPAVTVKEQEIDFASGSTVRLPPATIMAFEWEIE